MTNFDELREHFASLDKQKLDAFTTIAVQTMLAVSQMQEILNQIDKDGEYTMHLAAVQRCLNTAADAAYPLIHQAYAAFPDKKENDDE